jgi:hypothetical protein
VPLELDDNIPEFVKVTELNDDLSEPNLSTLILCKLWAFPAENHLQAGNTVEQLERLI